MAKAWGHPCHSGMELEISERIPKLSFCPNIAFTSSEPVLTGPPRDLRCPCRWLLWVSFSHSFLTLKAFTAQKGSKMYNNTVMPGKTACQFNLNQFDKSGTLSGQQPTTWQHKASLVRFSALLFLLQVITSDQETNCKCITFCWQYKAGEKQELQFERQGKCNMMCFPL